MPPILKLGKAPVKHDPRTLQFSNYVKPAVLPIPPAVFGHQNLVPDYGMCANDKYGCCVWAAAAHETKLWNAECKKVVDFTDAAVLSDYAAVTGFDPKTGAGDNGTNMLDALNYRRKVGVVDAHGVRHQIEAYVQLKTGDLLELEQAMYLFGLVEIGIKFPASAMHQFNTGQAWDVVKGSKVEGGHDVPMVGKNGSYLCVTWGKQQPMTAAFYKKYTDESYVLLTTEMLDALGKSLEGFDVAALRADLAALKHK